MKIVKRKNNNSSVIDDLADAQKLSFAPLAFQGLAAMLDLGIIQLLDKKSMNEKEIMSALNLDVYTISTLLHIGKLNNLIIENDNNYSLTRMAKLFLYDEMTKANFNFVKDVCYLGASELAKSFKDRQPRGLHKFIGNYPAIYPALTKLPEPMKKSWYEFDHLYSDNCFGEVFTIITQKYNSIFDIGGNTGKFETLCLDNDENLNITMLDLKENIETLKNNSKLKNCKFHPINVLDKYPQYPEIKNSAVLMSQFLDCFSKQDIKKIFNDLHTAMDDNSSIYILEPYIDQQKFHAAEYSLVHISLYFTCMANGVSKMYTFKEMREMIETSGFCLINCFNDIGSYNYTLLECKKDAMVSN